MNRRCPQNTLQILFIFWFFGVFYFGRVVAWANFSKLHGSGFIANEEVIDREKRRVIVLLPLTQSSSHTLLCSFVLSHLHTYTNKTFRAFSWLDWLPLFLTSWGVLLLALPIFTASLKLAIITNMIDWGELLQLFLYTIGNCLMLCFALLSFEGGFHYTYNNKELGRDIPKMWS